MQAWSTAMAILPDFDAAKFEPGAPIDNRYFPLIPGRVMSYQGVETDPETGEKTTERNDLFTTSAHHTVRGVETTVIRDTVYEDDLIIEDTFDWYAQDTVGNVWYFGEIVINYEYDDEGNFIGINHDGEWSADDPGSAPGWHTKAEPTLGPAYYLEYAPGIAEDESIIVATGLTVTTPFGTYEDVVQVIDSSALNTGIEFKFYAPGVGEITEKAFAEDGTVTTVVDLYRDVRLGVADPDDSGDFTLAVSKLREGKAVKNVAEARDLAPADFAGTGVAKHVTVIGGKSDSADALGAYFIDAKTGAISGARILVPDLSEAPQASLDIVVPTGKTLGLFLVRAADEIGVDLEEFADGGLRFVNLLTGKAATIADPYAATVMDSRGSILPIQPLHALGADDGTNTINPAGSLNAIGLSSAAAGAGVRLIGFEDRLNSSPEYDGDYNDAIVAVSAKPLSSAALQQLRLEARGAHVGTGGGDKLVGGADSDWLVGLGGPDRLYGGGGKDRLEGGAGDDWLSGGAGGDDFRFTPGAGEDRIADFSRGAGDRIVLSGVGAGFGFDDLDSNGDGRVGKGDARVELEAGALELELGAGTEIELAGVASLQPDAFVFLG
jgi:hypothetical protein